MAPRIEYDRLLNLIIQLLQYGVARRNRNIHTWTKNKLGSESKFYTGTLVCNLMGGGIERHRLEPVKHYIDVHKVIVLVRLDSHPQRPSRRSCGSFSRALLPGPGMLWAWRDLEALTSLVYERLELGRSTMSKIALGGRLQECWIPGGIFAI